MMKHTRSPQTKAAIIAAMEKACVTGDLEAAERLFVSFRLLFADDQPRESRSCIGSPVSDEALTGDGVKVVQWW